MIFWLSENDQELKKNLFLSYFYIKSHFRVILAIKNIQFCILLKLIDITIIWHYLLYSLVSNLRRLSWYFIFNFIPTKQIRQYLKKIAKLSLHTDNFPKNTKQFYKKHSYHWLLQRPQNICYIDLAALRYIKTPSKSAKQ